MTTKVPDYIEEPFKEKIEAVLQRMRNNIPESIEDLFVSTPARLLGGSDIYTLWLFTENFVVKVRNPLDLDRIQHDMAYLAKNVDWVQLDARHFDFSTPTGDSHLELQFTTADGLSGELWGSGPGCARLMEIYKARFLANFYPQASE